MSTTLLMMANTSKVEAVNPRHYQNVTGLHGFEAPVQLLAIGLRSVDLLTKNRRAASGDIQFELGIKRLVYGADIAFFKTAEGDGSFGDILNRNTLFRQGNQILKKP